MIDTHADTTPYFQDRNWRFAERHARTETHMDLPRIREGGLDAQFWSIYLGEREDEGLAIREALERIDAVHQMVAAHEDVVLATTAAELRRAVRSGRFASLIGIEGGHMIEDRLSVLRTYYRLGARYMTLTHSFHTHWADSSGTTEVPEALHGGLTGFGRDVVLEMNRLGMMVDVSHVSDATFEDVLATSRAPVIASHSACRALANHPRNLSDPMLRALSQNGGVIMINFYPAYLDESVARETRVYYREWREAFTSIRNKFGDALLASSRARRAHYALHPVPQVPIASLIDHIEHAISVAGSEHVGLGADWDGVPSMPAGMDDVSELPKLTEMLLARGHSEEVIRGVLGENLLRVMAEVEQVAHGIAREGEELRKILDRGDLPSGEWLTKNQSSPQRRTKTRKSRYSGEQIIAVLREAEGGRKVPGLFRECDIRNPVGRLLSA